MERRGFLKKMWTFAAGSVCALLPIGWISSNRHTDILEIGPEKTTPVVLTAGRFCSCPCKKDYTKSQVHSHAWAKPQVPTDSRPPTNKTSPTTKTTPTNKTTTNPPPTDTNKKPPKRCTCSCPSTSSSAGQHATQKSVVGTMEGRE